MDGWPGPNRQDQFDEAYTGLWAEFSKEKIDEHTFLKLNSEGLQVVLPRDRMRRVEQAAGKWSAVREDLSEMASNSTIGKKLFQRACDALANEQVESTITELIRQLPQSLTKANTQGMYRSLVTATHGIPGNVLAKRRAIVLDFRGVQISLTVATAQEELQLRLVAHLKASLPHEALPKLPFEGAFSRPAVMWVQGRAWVVPTQCYARGPFLEL